MQVHRLVPFLFVLAFAAACGADSNGAWCSILDMGFDGDDKYCPDPEAPEKCEDIRDDLIDKVDTCATEAGYEITDDELDDAANELDCDSAKAIGPDEDECRDDLDDADCNADGTVDLPDSCKGVVKTW